MYCSKILFVMFYLKNTTTLITNHKIIFYNLINLGILINSIQKNIKLTSLFTVCNRPKDKYQ